MRIVVCCTPNKYVPIREYGPQPPPVPKAVTEYLIPDPAIFRMRNDAVEAAIYSYGDARKCQGLVPSTEK